MRGLHATTKSRPRSLQLENAHVAMMSRHSQKERDTILNKRRRRSSRELVQFSLGKCWVQTAIALQAGKGREERGVAALVAHNFQPTLAVPAPYSFPSSMADSS